MVNVDYEITPEDLKHQLDAENPVIVVDVREPWERDVAKIDPSRHIPMADIPARMQELDPDDHIVVYCHHGVRSMNVTAWLRQQGYERVQSLAGGIDRWAQVVDRHVPKY